MGEDNFKKLTDYVLNGWNLKSKFTIIWLMHPKLLKIGNDYVKAIYITCGHSSVDTINDSISQSKCTITGHDHCIDLT